MVWPHGQGLGGWRHTGNVDGYGDTARITRPCQCTFDSQGNMYLAGGWTIRSAR
jgi:hypothetical protein